MKGLGTDEEMLVHILGNRSSDQRVKIRDQYKNMFGRVSRCPFIPARRTVRLQDLSEDIKGDTSGNFCKVLKNLLYTPVEYDCQELKRAIKGAGTDEEALIEILASRSSARLRAINETYQRCEHFPLDAFRSPSARF